MVSAESTFDAAIVGGGPAAWVAALALAAEGVSVVVLARPASGSLPVGEHVVGEAQSILAEVGVADALDRAGTPCELFRVRRTDRLDERHGMLRAWGGGWVVHRGKLETALRNAALERGVCVRQGMARVRRSGSRTSGIVLSLATPSEKASLIEARCVLDASGSGASIARGFGAKRQAHDRMRASILSAAGNACDRGRRSKAVCALEIQPHGWSYAARQSDGGVVRLDVADSWQLPGQAVPFQRMIGSGATPDICGRRSVAVGLTAPVAGDRWIAVGDAAVSFDPLCGRGVAWAAATALAGGRAVASLLRGDASAVSRYQAMVERLWVRHLRERRDAYALEHELGGGQFWARRIKSGWAASSIQGSVSSHA